MNATVERLFIFMKKESFMALILYVVTILSMQVKLPVLLMFSCVVIQMCVFVSFFENYFSKFIYSINSGKIKVRGIIKNETKNIIKELIMFIPILVISVYIRTFFIVGQPANETSVNELLKTSPIQGLMCVIIFGPIIEEFVFRFLPYKFIKNKEIVYIIFSAVIFAGLHVINDPKPFYYIWCYMLNSIYYGYRYYKTKDLGVTISMHIFNNIIATIF